VSQSVSAHSSGHPHRLTASAKLTAGRPSFLLISSWTIHPQRLRLAASVRYGSTGSSFSTDAHDRRQSQPADGTRRPNCSQPGQGGGAVAGIGRGP
jgi:hypothetical protein